MSVGLSPAGRGKTAFACPRTVILLRKHTIYQYLDTIWPIRRTAEFWSLNRGRQRNGSGMAEEFGNLALTCPFLVEYPLINWLYRTSLDIGAGQPSASGSARAHKI